jgi:predicted enzyme related to lactoylglutathione lyase
VTANSGFLVYLNADGRIQHAVKQVEKLGGKVVEPIHSIGPHGFRALVIDSEGNRVALHSMTDA